MQSHYIVHLKQIQCMYVNYSLIKKYPVYAGYLWMMRLKVIYFFNIHFIVSKPTIMTVYSFYN